MSKKFHVTLMRTFVNMKRLSLKEKKVNQNHYRQVHHQITQLVNIVKIANYNIFICKYILFQLGESFYSLCKSGNHGKCELKKDINIQNVDRQFSFWYYMFGLKIGTLNLTVDGVEVWKKEGRQQKKWLHSGNITLPVGTYEVIIEI